MGSPTRASYLNGYAAVAHACCTANIYVLHCMSQLGLRKMSTKPTTTIRIDPEVKRLAGKVFDDIGLSLSAAINTFLKAVAREGTMPFEIAAGTTAVRPTTGNATLNRASLVKKDEFYTQYEDVAREMVRHRDNLKGKSVFCNCDDPFESAFFRFFVLQFDKLGLKSLTTTCFDSSSFAGQEYPLDGVTGAYKSVVTEVPETPLIRPDGSLDLEPLFAMPGNSLEHLRGNGDFRSDECKKLLETADVVATNPPFSLFREFIAQLVDYKKDFIILGNMNATTTKEIFPLFQDNRVWYGETIRSGDRKFYVPDDYPLNAASCGVDESGRRFIRVKGVRWFTNLETKQRHTTIELTRDYSPDNYQKYDNYDAINIERTQDIPGNYDGVMGVPITFLDKYSPDQFEIVMLANGNARANVSPEVLAQVNYRAHVEDRGGVGIINGKRVYARVLIRRKLS